MLSPTRVPFYARVIAALPADGTPVPHHKLMAAFPADQQPPRSSLLKMLVEGEARGVVGRTGRSRGTYWFRRVPAPAGASIEPALVPIEPAPAPVEPTEPTAATAPAPGPLHPQPFAEAPTADDYLACRLDGARRAVEAAKARLAEAEKYLAAVRTLIEHDLGSTAQP